jgi:hypothetical protein
MMHFEGGLWDSTSTMAGRWELIGYPPVVQKHDDACFAVRICDEACAFCSLCFVCVWRSERAEACMAAIARTYASAYMAGESA